MKRKIRVAIIGGAGYVAQVCVRALLDRDAEIVLAIGNKSKLGVDVAEIAGLPAIGVPLKPQTEIDALLKETKPDVAIDCTFNEMERILPNAKACLEHGVSVIAVGVFCYYPQFSSPEIARELDAIAKANHCSFLGSSSGEVWQILPALISSGCGSLKKITMSFHALVDDFGGLVAKGLGIGEPPEKWDQLANADEGSPWEPVVRLLARQLGLTITGYKFEQVPIPSPKDIDHEKLGFLIPKGSYLGRDEYVTVETEEGIEIVSVCHTKVADPGEMNSYEIAIEGEPNLDIKITEFCGDLQTSTIMVNRIPDMLDAPKGVITVNDLPTPTYKSKKAFFVEE